MPSIKVTVPSIAWSTEPHGLNLVAKSSGIGVITPCTNVHIYETTPGGYALCGEVMG